MPPEIFEPTTAVLERVKRVNSLDLTATVIRMKTYINHVFLQKGK
jgi:hypothetical protein